MLEGTNLASRTVFERDREERILFAVDPSEGIRTVFGGFSRHWVTQPKEVKLTFRYACSSIGHSRRHQVNASLVIRARNSVWEPELLTSGQRVA